VLALKDAPVVAKGRVFKQLLRWEKKKGHSRGLVVAKARRS
jgi:hypothetical protein